MKLLVDIGNSRVKWAFGTAGHFLADGEALHDDDAGLRRLLDADWTPDELRIANVAGTVVGTRIASRLQKRFQLAPVFASSAATGAGVRNGYSTTGQLGVDRWLAICAAYASCHAPVCVVSAGTATTIDIVAGSGEHQGGLILPGIELMQSALFRGTGDLARLWVESDLVDPLAGEDVSDPLRLGRNTAAAIHYGALQATARLVRACMTSFSGRTSLGAKPPALFLTGGAAPALQVALPGSGRTPGSGSPWAFGVEYRPHLVLEGLALDPPCFGVGG